MPPSLSLCAAHQELIYIQQSYVSRPTLHRPFTPKLSSSTQELIYIHQFSDEKNWVPWEGSSLMTYPRYPGFEPHTVIEWNSYDSPLDVLEFKSVAPEPFMQEYRQETGGWIR